MDIKKLEQEQRKIAKKIILKDDFKKIDRVAGVVTKYLENKIIAVIVVCDYKTMNVLEKEYFITEQLIPYSKEFKCFNESKTILEAYGNIDQDIDLFFVLGNGILHPRRCGLASYLGVILDKPSIGVSKSLSIGEVKEDKVYLNKKVVGFELITKQHARPLYISPGNKISIKGCAGVIQKTIRPPHKLPEPLYLANRYAKEIREKLTNKND